MEFSFCPACGKECVSSRALGTLSWVCWECGKVYRLEFSIGSDVAVEEVPPLLRNEYCSPSVILPSLPAKPIVKGVS